MSPSSSSSSPQLLQRNQLFGRDRERQALQAALKRMVKKRSTNAVWVQGPSGSGKSALIASTLEHAPPLVREQGLYAAGKFDVPAHEHENHEHASHNSSSNDGKSNNKNFEEASANEDGTSVASLRSAHSLRSKSHSIRDLLRASSGRRLQPTPEEGDDEDQDANQQQEEEEHQDGVSSTADPSLTQPSSASSSSKKKKKDILQQTLLYQGIRGALSQVCEQLLNLPSEEEEEDDNDEQDNNNDSKSRNNNSIINGLQPKTRQAAQAALSTGLDASSWQVLDLLIPNLAALRPKPEEDLHSASDSTTISAMTQDTPFSSPKSNHYNHNNNNDFTNFNNFQQLTDRFKLASRRFLQTVSHFVPLVLVLDDLQFADPSSLDLLSSWIQDSDNGSLLIVGCYRNDDPGSGAVIKMIHQVMGGDHNHHHHNNKNNHNINLNHNRTTMATTGPPGTSVIPMQTIIMRDLGLSEIEDMLETLLSSNDLGSTVELAEILVNKTKGNGYFVVKLLEYLNQQQLLVPKNQQHPQHNNNSNSLDQSNHSKWQWDTKAIRKVCDSIDDVASLISLTLEQPENAVPRTLLPIVACIGLSCFASSMLFRVLDNMSQQDFESFSSIDDDEPIQRPTDMAKMTQLLDECVQQGFLMRTGSSNDTDKASPPAQDNGECSFQFVHDQVQLAALNMLKKDERVKLEFKIGEALLSSCNPKELDEMIFAILDLINPRAAKLRSSNPKRMEIAKLNARAASLAMQSSSFPIASWYNRRAISLLPPSTTRWEDDSYYQDTLQMYTAGAIAESLGGNAENMLWYADRVRENGRDIMDKIPIYHMLMDWFLDQDRASESFDMGVRVMEYLGGSIPTNELHVKGSTLTGLLKTKKMVDKYMSSTDVQELSIVKDAKELAIMKTLDKLGTAAYLDRKKLIPVIIFKGVRKTFKNGITPFAPPFLAAYGYAMTNHLGDFSMGKKCGGKALEMLDKDKRIDVRARTKAIVYGVNLHFMTPMESVIAPLHQSYLEGVESGDFRNAMFSAALHLQALFASGKSLSLIESSCRVVMKVFQDFKQPHFKGVLKGMWQGYLNLMGDFGNTTMLTGSVMDQNQVFGNNHNNSDDDTHLQHHHEMSAAMIRRLQMNLRRVQLSNAVFFGEFRYGAELAVECGDEILEKLRGQIASVTLQFDCAYCCYRMAQSLSSPKSSSCTGQIELPSPVSSVKRRKYLRHATKAHKRIKDLVAKLNPNCRHFCALLDAELAILNDSGDSMLVTHHLDEALAFAAKDEMIHDQALILERYATYWRSQGGEYMSNFRIRAMNSLILYQQWGAHAKVNMLKKEWGHDLVGYLEKLPQVETASETMEDVTMSSISDSYW